MGLRPRRLGPTRDRSFPSRTTAPSTRRGNQSAARVRHSPRHCPEDSAGPSTRRGAGSCPRPAAEALPGPPAPRSHRNAPAPSRPPLRQRRAPELSAGACRSRWSARPGPRGPAPGALQPRAGSGARSPERPRHSAPAPIPSAEERSEIKRYGKKERHFIGDFTMLESTMKVLVHSRKVGPKTVLCHSIYQFTQTFTKSL